MVFECEGSSGRVLERSSARVRGLDRARRRAEFGSLRHVVITVHIELPVLESHVAPNYTAQLQASKHAIAQAIASGSEYWRCRDPVI